MLICNAFSLNMLHSTTSKIDVVEVEVSKVLELVSLYGVHSAVGHADTAAVFSSVLGVSVPMNRTTVSLSHGDSIIVGQYSGPRLAEGTTELPNGAKIVWVVLTVV